MDNLKEYMRLAGVKYRATSKGKGNILLRHAKQRSARKGLSCDLDKEWVNEKLQKQICELSGIKFDFTNNDASHFNPYCPSIDRIDPTKGYTKDNCRMVLVAVNFGLGEWGINSYIKIAQAVIDTQKSKIEGAIPTQRYIYDNFNRK
jgi:hypothetical protein